MSSILGERGEIFAPKTFSQPPILLQRHPESLWNPGDNLIKLFSLPLPIKTGGQRYSDTSPFSIPWPNI